MEETGAECQLQPFLPGFAPNIICAYPSSTNSTEHVVLSAHYDSRGSWGSTVAPGGDDDGSGSGHLLAVGQTIGKAGIKFEKKVVLAFFAGEEQGLLGSHAFAGEYIHEPLHSVDDGFHALIEQKSCTTIKRRCCSTSRRICSGTTS